MNCKISYQSIRLARSGIPSVSMMKMVESHPADPEGQPRWPTDFGHLGRRRISSSLSIFRFSPTPDGQISPLATWGGRRQTTRIEQLENG